MFQVLYHPVIFKGKVFKKIKIVIDMGNFVRARYAKNPPFLDWLDDWERYYTVMMIGKN